jgi:hypothetical protein
MESLPAATVDLHLLPVPYEVHHIALGAGATAHTTKKLNRTWSYVPKSSSMHREGQLQVSGKEAGGQVSVADADVSRPTDVTGAVGIGEQA